MRRTFFPLTLAFLVGCAGTRVTASPPSTPPPAPPIPAVQHEDPVPAPPPPAPTQRRHFSSVIPGGWTRMPGEDDQLVNPTLPGRMLVYVIKTNHLDPADELKDGMASLKALKYGEVKKSKDGHTAWVTITGTNPKNPASGVMVARRVPKEADTPYDVTVIALGMSPPTNADALTKDVLAYVSGFHFHS